MKKMKILLLMKTPSFGKSDHKKPFSHSSTHKKYSKAILDSTTKKTKHNNLIKYKKKKVKSQLKLKKSKTSKTIIIIKTITQKILTNLLLKKTKMIIKANKIPNKAIKYNLIPKMKKTLHRMINKPIKFKTKTNKIKTLHIIRCLIKIKKKIIKNEK